MKVAVVTPYYKESKKVLKRCLDSVAKQTYDDVIHVVVADGYPQDWVNDYTLHHICMPNVGNFGDTPRGMGAAYAVGIHVDAIVFLDADCWIERDHIDRMLDTLRSGSSVITCPRNVWLDGELAGPCNESNGIHFNDTNCYLISKPYFHVLSAWMFKNQKDCVIGDRVFWDMIKRSGANILRCRSHVNYESDLAFHYQMFGKEPPKDSRVLLNDKIVKWGDYVNGVN
jgi:glycosyltransferase involved in cell wall biosynthesis